MFGHIGLPPDNSSVIIVIYDVILYYYIVHSILMATVKFIYTDNVTDNSPKSKLSFVPLILKFYNKFIWYNIILIRDFYTLD